MMAVDTAWYRVLAAAALGLALSVIIESLMTPRPPLARPWRAWGIHAGLWLLAHSAMSLAGGRPWFAAAAVSAFLLILVLVNNAKMRSLREPFVFQDYEYFTDAIRHPRLYIPFMGWGNFVGAAAGFLLAVSVGLWGEQVPAHPFAVSGQLGGILAEAGVGALLLLSIRSPSLPVSFDASLDLRTLGLLANLWRYQEEECRLPSGAPPFDAPDPGRSRDALPHLIAVQSESFFDPRSLYPGIRAHVLKEFDQLKVQAVAFGQLQVPAWGANTVRTEFAFLTAVEERGLGIHRFNPYRALAAGWQVPAFPAFLQRLGYRTICLHPYPASFYRRDRVLPRLGFDEFLDIRAFAGAKRCGPYVCDAAVADKVASIVNQASGPVFVFAITMENHGPLHLERAEPSEGAELYTTPPPAGCEDLTIYLRHLRNADRMVGELRKTLTHCDRAASLCWFGDHVPIMPSVYDMFGAPAGEVEYVLWSNRQAESPRERTLQIHRLAGEWLRWHKSGDAAPVANSF